QVDCGCAKAELAPGQPVEAEVNAFDEHVLGDDEPGAELRRIVLDADDQAATLELGQEAELTELREPHRLPRGGRDPSPHGSRRRRPHRHGCSPERSTDRYRRWRSPES